MADLSIKIRIAEREYPMRVDESEEERLRLAGRLINERLRVFKDEFRIEDKQDLLAMVVFECMAEKLKLEAECKEADTRISDRLSNLHEIISQNKNL